MKKTSQLKQKLTGDYKLTLDVKKSDELSKQKQSNQQSLQSRKSQNKSHQKSKQHNQNLLNKRIVNPQKLKILVLSGNELQNDELDFLAKCLNLVKLDLSNNHITKIHDRFGIRKINNLRVMNLDSNRLATMQSIQALFGMNNLNLFSFRDNPLEEYSKSEHLIVNNFPNLKAINSRIVFLEQRDPSLIVQRRNEFLSKDFDEWQPAQHSEKYYLRVLRLHLQFVDNMWMFHNPVIKIQRVWRAILQQQIEQIKLIKIYPAIQQNKSKAKVSDRFLEADSLQIPLQDLLKRSFSQWREMILNIRSIKQELSQLSYKDDQQKIVTMQNKQFLSFGIKEYYLAKRNLKIRDDLQRFIKRIRQKLYIRKRMERFRKNIHLKSLSFANAYTSYYNLSGLKENKKLLFNRVQQHLIQNFLAHIAKNFSKHKQIYNQGNFGVQNQYVAVRLMDPDTYASKVNYGGFTYLMWPCMKSVILKKKKFPYKLKSSIIKIKALSYIKNRDKKLTPEQAKKSNKIYARIDRFFQHEYYEGMGFYECKDEFVLRQLLRMIYYHNTRALQFEKIIQRSEMMSLLQNYKQSVSIYTQKLLQRTTSAVKIQQQWRRYTNNKRQKESIYDKLKKNRACRLIQRFIRDRVFYHRLSFQKRLSLDLSLFDQKDLLIHHQLYSKLPQLISQMESHVELYSNLRIEISHRIQLLHEDFNQKEVFFPVLRKRHLGDQLFSSKAGTSNLSTKVDIYRFFHQNANVKIIQCKGQKFYQFIYSSVEQAKLRAACLALLTYRMYGGSYLLPLSKTNLHMYNQRVKQYHTYGIHCKPFEISAIQNLNKLIVNTTTDISQQSKSAFIFLDPSYEILFSKKDPSPFRKSKVAVQFYQKRFQDYPDKYYNFLTVLSYEEEEEQAKAKQIQEKFVNIRKLMIQQHQIYAQGQWESDVFKSKSNYVRDQNIEEKRKDLKSVNKQSKKLINLSTNNIKILSSGLDQEKNGLFKKETFASKQEQKESKPNGNSFSYLKDKGDIIPYPTNLQISIKKTYEKRISLYELDSPSTLIQMAKEHDLLNKTHNFQKSILQENQTKRSKVTKYLEGERQKRDYIKQKKQADLGLVREKRRQQKMMNMTLKGFQQSERTELLKKKTEKIKQYKRRSLSSSNKVDESDFMQQGNFLMEQHLKMNLMRNKAKQIEKLRQNKKSISQTKTLRTTPSIRQQSQDSRSIKSIQNKASVKRKQFFGGKDFDLIEMDRKLMPSASLDKHSAQIFGGQTEIVNKKPYVKKRSSKGGAYLRDPSFVHGVFPEQYYPIQNSKGGSIFPRVI